jgi:hypothetical protein
MQLLTDICTAYVDVLSLSPNTVAQPFTGKLDLRIHYVGRSGAYEYVKNSTNMIVSRELPTHFFQRVSVPVLSDAPLLLSVWHNDVIIARASANLALLQLHQWNFLKLPLTTLQHHAAAAHLTVRIFLQPADSDFDYQPRFLPQHRLVLSNEGLNAFSAGTTVKGVLELQRSSVVEYYALGNIWGVELLCISNANDQRKIARHSVANLDFSQVCSQCFSLPGCLLFTNSFSEQFNHSLQCSYSIPFEFRVPPKLLPSYNLSTSQGCTSIDYLLHLSITGAGSIEDAPLNIISQPFKPPPTLRDGEDWHLLGAHG